MRHSIFSQSCFVDHLPAAEAALRLALVRNRESLAGDILEIGEQVISGRIVGPPSFRAAALSTWITAVIQELAGNAAQAYCREHPDFDICATPRDPFHGQAHGRAYLAAMRQEQAAQLADGCPPCFQRTYEILYSITGDEVPCDE